MSIVATDTLVSSGLTGSGLGGGPSLSPGGFDMGGIDDYQIAKNAGIRTSKLEGGGGGILYGTPGARVLHVDSTNTAYGLDKPYPIYGTIDKPFLTIDYAISQCRENKGDVILVHPGHTETIAAAAGIDMDRAGVTIIGLGHGPDRPTITMATSTAATLHMDAIGSRVSNLLFVCDIDSLVTVIDIDKADCVVNACEFREGTAKQFLTAVDIAGAGANACDRAVVANCVVRAVAAGPAQAIELGEVAAYVQLLNNQFIGNFSNAAIHNPTGKVLADLLIQGGMIDQKASTLSLELVSACTGNIRDLFISSPVDPDTPADVIDPGACRCDVSIIAVDSVDVRGIPVPAAT